MASADLTSRSSTFLRRHPKLSLAVGGGALGLAGGLTYWFAWGCTRCAKDNSPYAVVAFFVLCGAAMAVTWGKDHLAPPPVL